MCEKKNPQNEEEEVQNSKLANELYGEDSNDNQNESFKLFNKSTNFSSEKNKNKKDNKIIKEKNKTEVNNNQKEKNKKENKIKKKKNKTEYNKKEENNGEKNKNRNKQKTIKICFCNNNDKNSKNNNNIINEVNDNNNKIIKSYPLEDEEKELPKAINFYINRKRKENKKIDESKKKKYLDTKKNTINSFGINEENMEEGLFFFEPPILFENRNKDDKIESANDIQFSQNDKEDDKSEEMKNNKKKSEEINLRDF